MGDKHHKKKGPSNKEVLNMQQPNEYVGLDAGGWKLEGNKAHVIPSIRYVQHSFECFSDWSKQDMKVFWNFIAKLDGYDWKNLLETCRKVGKAGLVPTIIPIEKYPDCKFCRQIKGKVKMFELRVDNTKRVHGFRDGPIFYICWLDKNHQICA